MTKNNDKNAKAQIENLKNCTRKPDEFLKLNFYYNLEDFEENLLDDFEDSDLQEKEFVNYLTENYEQHLRNLTKTEIWKPEHTFLDSNLLGNFFDNHDVKNLKTYKQSQSFIYVTNENGDVIAHVYKPLAEYFKNNNLELFQYRELIDNLELILNRLKEIRAGLSVKSLPELLGIEAESDKIFVNCNPQMFGQIITELINKGYISAPTDKGKMSPTKMFRMLFKHFNFPDYEGNEKEIDYLRKTIGVQNSVTQSFTDRLHIPPLSQFTK